MRLTPSNQCAGMSAVLIPLIAYGTDLGPVLSKSEWGDLLEIDVPLIPSEAPVE